MVSEPPRRRYRRRPKINLVWITELELEAHRQRRARERREREARHLAGGDPGDRITIEELLRDMGL